ncbi:hypothetical protein [Candidatus Neptunochlamydia vexilliferae]|uniref:hypothetical protein n=1 Tax=Candidatus Neptunichlamydia vexilliferae TaxID=1651774 RepID=UPI001890ED25|nr:hypothetical protein [Candidatus Neptunochlamydia vexilliferae]
MRICQCFILLLLLCGCEKYYVSIKREIINRESLASTFVGSPDPLQADPPRGQELLLEWRLPRRGFSSDLTLVLDILYKDHSQETVCYPVTRKRGVVTFSLLGEKFQETKGFLTYKATIQTPDGEVLKEWKQQLWADLIVID